MSWRNLEHLEAVDLPDLVRALASMGVDGIKVWDRFAPRDLTRLMRGGLPSGSPEIPTYL